MDLLPVKQIIRVIHAGICWTDGWTDGWMILLLLKYSGALGCTASTHTGVHDVTCVRRQLVPPVHKHTPEMTLWCATPPKQQVSAGEALLIAPSQTLRKQTYPRLKEWMADLTGCYCSLQTTLRKEIQECERQLRWWSLFGFLDANVTSAAPSAEPLSTFHFSDSKLPTSNCIVPNVLPVIRAESVFPLSLTDTLCTRNLFAPPFFPSVSQPGFCIQSAYFLACFSVYLLCSTCASQQSGFLYLRL